MVGDSGLMRLWIGASKEQSLVYCYFAILTAVVISCCPAGNRSLEVGALRLLRIGERSLVCGTWLRGFVMSLAWTPRCARHSKVQFRQAARLRWQAHPKLTKRRRHHVFKMPLGPNPSRLQPLVLDWV